jgi:hypothetical protein
MKIKGNNKKRLDKQKLILYDSTYQKVENAKKTCPNACYEKGEGFLRNKNSETLEKERCDVRKEIGITEVS